LGRVVITHSTYIEGLIPWLKQLSRQERIQTITPGVISRVRGHSPLLRLRISIQTCAGFKLVARKGSSVQEVFVVTELTEAELMEQIKSSKP